MASFGVLCGVLATKVLIVAKLVSGYAGDHEHVDVAGEVCIYLVHEEEKRCIFSLHRVCHIVLVGWCSSLKTLTITKRITGAVLLTSDTHVTDWIQAAHGDQL